MSDPRHVPDPWAFWRAAIAGEQPETTPGTPHAGFYLLRERRSWPNPAPEIGGPRRKTATHFWPVAIWHDEEGWHCVITRRGTQVHLTDVDAIDEVFSRVCRAPITHVAYQQMGEELKETANV